MHFEVEFPIPAVDGQACLLRWHRARTLNRSEVAREDYAALQLLSSRIATA
jgi:hypothetical protein